MFISLAYPGSISDKEITKQSGYLGLMEPYTELTVMSVLLREFILWFPQENNRVRCCPKKLQKQIKLQKHMLYILYTYSLYIYCK